MCLSFHEAPAVSSKQPSCPKMSMATKNLWLFCATQLPTTCTAQEPPHKACAWQLASYRKNCQGCSSAQTRLPMAQMTGSLNAGIVDSPHNGDQSDPA